MKTKKLLLGTFFFLLSFTLLATQNNSSVTNEGDPLLVDGGVFVAANLFNIYPENARSSAPWEAGMAPFWRFRGAITNGTQTGTYYENVKVNGGTAPDVTMEVDDVLDPNKVYEIWFFFVSPSTQYWAVKAKLPSSTEFKRLHRDSPLAIVTPDKDGNTDRSYRALLGTVTGSPHIVVDISSNFSSEVPDAVVRSVFVGLTYKEVNPQSGLINSRLNNELVSYPNPATNYLNVKLPDGINQTAPIQVYSANGQLHYCRFNLEDNKLKIDINHLPVGYYYAKLSTSEGIFTTKFSKML